MIVKRYSIFLIIFLGLISCTFDANDSDNEILKFILKHENFKKEDSLYFQEKMTNKRVISFFNDRNREYEGFKPYSANSNIINYKDSTNLKIDSIVYKKLPIINNNYIFLGKGIDKKAELFLKDSFNYNYVDNIIWKLNKKEKNKFLEKRDNVSLIKISKPVYNLDYDKAITFVNILHEGISDRRLFFLEKKNNNWHLVYKENRN